jgi:hypothetical protein
VCPDFIVAVEEIVELTWALPGLMDSISMPSPSHHTDSLLSPKGALGLAKGTPVSA